MRIPIVFVEESVSLEELLDEGRRLRESVVLLERNGKTMIFLDKGEKPPEKAKPEKILVKKVYDDAYAEIFDLVEGTVRREALLIMPDRRTFLRLLKGDRVILVGLKKRRVELVVDVGNLVRRGERIGFTVSKKGVIRYVRAPETGTVAYVAENPETGEIILFIKPLE